VSETWPAKPPATDTATVYVAGFPRRIVTDEGLPLPAVLGLVGGEAHNRVGPHPPVAGGPPGRPVQRSAGQRSRRGDEIDFTPLDVLVRLDDGVEGRAGLTGMVDVATRTVTAAVLQPCEVG